MKLDILDTRELETRRKELEDERDAFIEDRPTDASVSLDAWNETSEADELNDLNTLSEDISEWRDGATLIAESDFENYAREYAEDVGAIPSDASWPCTCIDWEQAARELQMDYSSCEYLGTTYLYRS